MLLFLALAMVAASGASIVTVRRKYVDEQRQHTVPAIITHAALGAPQSMPLVIVSHGLLGFPQFAYLAHAFARAGYVYCALDDYDGFDVSSPLEFGRDLAFLKQALPQDPDFGAAINTSAIAVGG